MPGAAGGTAGAAPPASTALLEQSPPAGPVSGGGSAIAKSRFLSHRLTSRGGDTPPLANAPAIPCTPRTRARVGVCAAGVWWCACRFCRAAACRVGAGGGGGSPRGLLVVLGFADLVLCGRLPGACCRLCPASAVPASHRIPCRCVAGRQGRCTQSGAGCRRFPIPSRAHPCPVPVLLHSWPHAAAGHYPPQQRMSGGLCSARLVHPPRHAPF